MLCILVNKQGLGPLWYTGVALLAIGGLMRWTLARSRRPSGERSPVPAQVPVAGRWTVLNGPGTFGSPSDWTSGQVTCAPRNLPVGW
ncbi:hypothetical protein [Streptomyces sp. NPDC088246]|uniref:hypothetical protein n=1 Tax=Streptomyces sp. NPDC088246 TaxID=3365842 RepID=UPI00380DF29C